MVLARAEAADLMFRLPEWLPDGDEALPETFVYWTDSGFLNQLLGFEEELLSGRPGQLTKAERDRNEFFRGKSWEGFAISTILRASASTAHGQFRQGSNGEIDLILGWMRPRTTWALEMTSARRKKVNGGFESGCAMTRADRAIVVVPDEQTAPSLQGASQTSRTIERLSLEAGLRAVLDGPL